jgi:hypothetical protein
MPALAPVAPEVLKRILELRGYKLLEDGQRNWLMGRDDHEKPLTIPKRGKVVTLPVIMNALDHAQMDNATYFALLAAVIQPKGTKH